MNLFRRFVQWNRKVCYKSARPFHSFFVDRFPDKVLLDEITRIVEKEGAAEVLELGGIDRPLLTKDSSFTYTGLDVEYNERCDELYNKFLVQSVEEPIPGRYDLIFSMTLLEHVRNNRRSIQNIFDSLQPGATTCHYVPAKWHPYAIILRLLGPNLQRSLIRILRPDSIEGTGYPAFFDYCSVFGMKRLFKRVGFAGIEVTPFYKATDYFSFFFPLFWSVAIFENLCAKLNLSIFAAGFHISARKPVSNE